MLLCCASAKSDCPINNLPVALYALQKLKMQSAHDLDAATSAGFAVQPGMSFFSKSAPMSAALNALVQPIPDSKARCFGIDSCTDSKAGDPIGGMPTSAGVAMLLAAFRTTGGVVRGDELAMMLEDRKMGDLASLGRAMATDAICSFQWRSAFWIPLFQFDLDKLTVKDGPSKIMQEFKGVFDGWMLAAWFAQPNSWLSGRKPVDLLGSNLPAVFEAARADRYVAVG